MNKGDMGKRRKEKGKVVVEGNSGTRKIPVVDNHNVGLPKGIPRGWFRSMSIGIIQS